MIESNHLTNDEGVVIKGKTKFVLASFKTKELGAKKGLMQDNSNSAKMGNHKKVPISAGSVATTNNMPETPSEELAKRLHQINVEIENSITYIANSLKTKDYKSLEAEKIVYNNLMKERQVIIQAKAEIDKAEITTKAEKDIAEKNLKTAEAYRSGAEAEAKEHAEIDKHKQGTNEINTKEADVFSIIAKHDMLKDPAKFQQMLNNSTDPAVKADALRLEQDIKDLGFAKFVKVDGVIDQNTIDAIVAVISENAPAIKAYKEVTGIDPLKPSIGGSKSVIEKDGR